MFKPGDIVLLGDIREQGFCMRTQARIPAAAFPVPALVVAAHRDGSKIQVEWIHPQHPPLGARLSKWNFYERHFNKIELLEET